MAGNGKRGAASGGGAAGHEKIVVKGGSADLEAIAKQLGFPNLDAAKTAAKAFEEVNKHTDAAHVARYTAEHRGGHSLGAIMLRIGLPRNKLLDIAHSLKPLRDHGILTAQFPMSFKGYEKPWDLSKMSADDVAKINVSSAIKPPDWLQRISLAGDALRRRLAQ